MNWNKENKPLVLIAPAVTGTALAICTLCNRAVYADYDCDPVKEPCLSLFMKGAEDTGFYSDRFIQDG